MFQKDLKDMSMKYKRSVHDISNKSQNLTQNLKSINNLYY